MNYRCAFIGVEGAHDQAFIRKVLQEGLGFEKFGGQSAKLSQINPIWSCFRANL